MLYKVFSKLSVLKLKPDSLNDYPDTEGCSYGNDAVGSFKVKMII